MSPEWAYASASQNHCCQRFPSPASIVWRRAWTDSSQRPSAAKEWARRWFESIQLSSPYDVGDSLAMDGMCGEEHRTHERWKRCRHIENQEEHQQRYGNVNGYVHKVKARRMSVPQPPFQSEARECDGPIEAGAIYGLRPIRRGQCIDDGSLGHHRVSDNDGVVVVGEAVEHGVAVCPHRHEEHQERGAPRRDRTRPAVLLEQPLGHLERSPDQSERAIGGTLVSDPPPPSEAAGSFGRCPSASARPSHGCTLGASQGLSFGPKRFERRM